MTCTVMLTLMLEAEHAELEGKGTSPVATHVRACARCRAVAARLLSDTAALAAHVTDEGPERTAARPGVARPVVWGGALAAVTVLAFVAMRIPGTPHLPADRPLREPVTAPVIAPSASMLRRDARVFPARFAPPVAATAVRFVASQATEAPMTPVDASGVSVAPAAGTHSAVLATRNAKITVVWLY